MGNVNKELFEDMPVPRAIMKLMLPTIVASLVTILYSLVDTFFVGMLRNEVQSAAVSLSAPVLLAFNAVNNLFGVGASSKMSRALGEGDGKTVRSSASFGFYGAVLSGALLSVLCTLCAHPLVRLLGASAENAAATLAYMRWAVMFGAVPTILNVVLAYLVRSEGNALHASVGTMGGCLLNIILDPIFILPFGLNMGAAGAGAATFLSNCIACVYFFVFLAVKREKTNIHLHPKYLHDLTGSTVKDILVTGVPASIQNLLNVTGMTILNNFIAGYGSAAVAAVGIAQKIYHLPIQAALGGSQGVMPLIGYSYSAKNTERFESVLHITLMILLPFMCVTAGLCFVFAAPLIRVFMDVTEVVAYGTLFLRGFAVSLPFMMVDFLGVGVFQSLGMGGKSLLFAVLRKIVLEIPFIFLFNTLFQANGITYAGAAAEVILAAASVFMLRRIVKDFRKECRTETC